jgi:hypothetical protein
VGHIPISFSKTDKDSHFGHNRIRSSSSPAHLSQPEAYEKMVFKCYKGGSSGLWFLREGKPVDPRLPTLQKFPGLSKHRKGKFKQPIDLSNCRYKSESRENGQPEFAGCIFSVQTKGMC